MQGRHGARICGEFLKIIGSFIVIDMAHPKLKFYAALTFVLAVLSG